MLFHKIFNSAKEKRLDSLFTKFGLTKKGKEAEKSTKKLKGKKKNNNKTVYQKSVSLRFSQFW